MIEKDLPHYRRLTLVVGLALFVVAAAVIFLLGLAQGLLEEWGPELARAGMGLMPIGVYIFIGVMSGMSLSCASSTGLPLFGIVSKADREKNGSTLDMAEILLVILGAGLSLLSLGNLFGEITEAKVFLLGTPALAAYLMRMVRLIIPALKSEDEKTVRHGILFFLCSFLLAFLPESLSFITYEGYWMFLFLLIPLLYLALLFVPELRDKESDI